ncbi:MAG: response regulator, partial [Flavobacteriales bacterium]
LHMPEMDGIEATRAIRDGRVKGLDSDLPIVCLTADVFKETKESIFSAGMNDFVTKPMELRRLFQVLGHWRKQINSRRES